MTLIQVCIACNKPISISTTPVYKDNNGDLIYHPKCFSSINILSPVRVSPIYVASLSTKVIPIRVVFGYNTGYDRSFIDHGTIAFPSCWTVHDIDAGSNVLCLHNAFSKWLSQITIQGTPTIYIEKSNLCSPHLGNHPESQVDEMIEIVGEWCYSTGTTYMIL